MIRKNNINKKKAEVIVWKLGSMKTTTTTTDQKHVMISYSWAFQDQVKKVREELRKHGFKVWFDIEQMAGSTVEAMAGAIEGSDAVLMCLSKSYKESPNCRAEAEYARNRKVPIIPLMIENHYNADGWLGFILGEKLWYASWDDKTMGDNLPGAIKELEQHTKATPSISTSTTTTSTSSIPVPTQAKKPSIRDWTADQTLHWLSELKLNDSITKAFTANKIRGRGLNQLIKLYKQDVRYFHHHILTNLGIKDMNDQLELSDALEEISI